MTRSRIPLLAALLLLISLGTPADAARRRLIEREPAPPLPAAEMDSLAAAALRGGVPGISIAFARGDAILARGYGKTVPAGRAVDPETIFQIASLSKQFTAAAILLLEAEGRLSVSDPITRWIPELDLGGRTVMLHHLLTHTSGLRSETGLTFDPYRPLAQADMIAAVGRRGFASEPGAEEEYNNAGYFLLGVVIERVTGATYASFLEQRFFVPLGLTRTAYCGTGPAVPVPSGSIEMFGIAYPTNPLDMSVPFAAGALCSTPSDLVAWSRALAEGRAIPVAAYAKMTTPARLNDGTPIDYGYGLGLGTIEGERATSHAGWISGFQSYLIHVPARGLTVAVLANANSSSHDWPREIARALVRTALAPQDENAPAGVASRDAELTIDPRRDPRLVPLASRHDGDPDLGEAPLPRR